MSPRYMLSQHPHLHPLEWAPRVSKVAKYADTAKTTKNCINCMSARPTPLHTNPMGPQPKNTFSAQNRGEKKTHDFRPNKKAGRFFFNIFDPPPHVTFCPVVVSLRGPGQSPVLPSACCVGLLLSVCRPLRPVLLLVLFPHSRSRSPVVGVLGLCWMWHGVPFVCQRRPVVGILR